MGCNSGKQAYKTRSKAKSVCKIIKSVGTGNLYKPCNHKLMPYRCRECGEWHLTSMNKLPGRSSTDE